MNLTQKSHLLLLVYQEIMIHIFFSFCLFSLYFSFHTGKNSHFPLHHSVSLVVDVGGDEGGGGDIPAVHPRQAGVPGLGGNL